MKTTKYTFIVLGLLLAFTACEKIVDLEVPSEEPRLVVQSQITNQKDIWRVHLQLSQPYFEQGSAEDISTAKVSISSSLGDTVNLVYADTGLYVSQDSQRCVVGEEYTLTIDYNGQLYVGSEVLPNGFPIDTIVAFFLPSNNGFIESGYYVFIQGQENPYQGDSYLWNFYKNDTLQEGFGLLVENDEVGAVSFLNPFIDPEDPLSGLADNILPRPFPFQVFPGDSIFLEQFNLTPRYFDYLLDVQTQLSRSGSPFDPPPANASNNLSNGALGYFSVAHKVEKEIVVVE